MYLGGSQRLLQDDKNGCLVNRSVSSPPDKSKEVNSNNIPLWVRSPIQVLSYRGRSSSGAHS